MGNKKSSYHNLNISHIRYRALLDTAVDGIIIINSQGIVDTFNPAAESLFGYCSEEVVGKNVSVLMPETFAIVHDNFIKNYLGSEDPTAIGIGREIEGQHKDGSVFPVEIALSEMQVDDQRLFVGFVRDISELRKAYKLVQASDERFNVSMRYANIGTWDWNIRTGELYWSERIGPLFGYEKNIPETTYDNFLAAIHPEDRQKVIDAVHDCVENHADYEVEHRVVWPDGTVRWVLERGDVVRDNEGKPLNMLGTVQDITVRKQAEVLNFGRSSILEQVSSSKPLSQTLMQVAKNVEDIDSEMICSITLVDGGALGDSFSPSLPDFFNNEFNGEKIDPKGSCISRVAHTKQPISVPDIFNHSSWHEYRIIAKKVGLRACLAEPILSADGEIYGVLTIYYRHPKKIASSEKTFVSQSTQLASIVIERQKQDKRLADQRLLLELLRNGMSQFIGAPDLKATAEYLLNGLLEVTASEYGFIGEAKTDKHGDTYLKIHAISDISWSQKGKNFAQNKIPQALEFQNLETLFGNVLTTRQPVISNSPGIDEHSAGLLVGRSKINAYFGMPIFYGDDLVGMFGIANRENGYDERLTSFLQPFNVAYGSIIYARRAMDREQQTRSALIKAKADADKANQAKSLFVSNMSHELRTPMNAILGFSQLLTISDLDENQQESVAEIEKAGRHLLDLINELLDLARIESGKLELSIQSVNIAEIFFEYLGLLTPQLEEKNLEISFWENGDKVGEYFEDREFLKVKADKTRLKQVMLNLLSNAIKYNTDNGDIKVECFSDDRRVRILVTDTGKGLSEDQQKQLFKAFERLSEDPSSIEGTGIGLVITKNLVELMDGEIGVYSEVGNGSTFWVEFPQEIAKKPVNIGLNRIDEAFVNIKSANDTQVQKILVVEDNLANQKVILQQLNIIGYEADIAMNGEEALGYLNSNKYACVLTDCNMPIMDGYQLAKQIRQNEINQLSRTPIIAVTAAAMGDEVDRCMAAGMDDFLTKPVDLYVLQNSLSVWVDKDHRIDKQILLDDILLQPTDDALDLSVLTASIGNDKEKQQYLLKVFQESATETIQNLGETIRTQAYSDVRFSAHKLKSAAKSVGATTLVKISEQIEQEAKNANGQTAEHLYAVLVREFEEFNQILGDLESKSIAQEDAQIYEVDLSHLNVLLVDDDKFLIEQMSSVLSRMGIKNPNFANNGKQALNMINEKFEKFDIMLCDLNMPGMDGIEFLRHLADLNYVGGLVLISGEDKRVLKTAEDLARAHGLNILGSIEKPISPESLYKLLGRDTQNFRVLSNNFNDITVEELVNAINSDQLTVFFQPQIEIHSRKLVGAEALVRWMHPQRGLVPPDSFISLAEENDLIHELTNVVFKQGMQQGKKWIDEGLNIKIALNLSVNSISRLDLPEWLLDTANQIGIPPKQIVLELTESRLMADVTSSLEVLTRLSLKGYSLSIDDFGTGYSTMEQLQRIPFKELKIDRSFVHGASVDDACRAIVESSIALAKSLNMKTVAEGVETEEDWKLIAKLGCDYVQGYYVAKPMPVLEFDRWLNKWK